LKQEETRARVNADCLGNIGIVGGKLILVNSSVLLSPNSKIKTPSFKRNPAALQGIGKLQKKSFSHKQQELARKVRNSTAPKKRKRKEKLF
jgi:hypothetical protein